MVHTIQCDRVSFLLYFPNSRSGAGIISLSGDRHGIGSLIRAAEIAADFIIIFAQCLTLQNDTFHADNVLLPVIIDT